jgi:uncharacterized protein
MDSERIREHFGLSDSTIGQIRAVFQGVLAIEKVVLYGSRAKGNYREGSDIDLTMLGRDLTYPLLVKIEGQLDDLLLPYTFDLSLFSQLENQDLIDHIARVGLDFYLKEETSSTAKS